MLHSYLPKICIVIYRLQGIEIIGIKPLNPIIIQHHDFAVEMKIVRKLGCKYSIGEITRNKYQEMFTGRTDDEAFDLIYKTYYEDAPLLTDEKEKWHYLFGLNVHHKYYQEGLYPWEYPDDALVTYCEKCHQNLHETTQIPYKDSQGRTIGQMTVCDRCGGAGELPQYWYVQNGICFKCGGARYLELIDKN
jgi:hypothetical protein